MRTIILFFLILNLGVRAQDIITLQEIEYGELVLVKINDFPQDKLPSKCTSAFLLFDAEKENFSFVGKISEETFKIISKIEGSYIYNMAKSYFDVVYSNDTIKVCSEMPFRATTYCHVFVFKNSKFVFVETEEDDPSAENAQKGEEFLEKGMIKEAVDAFMNVMYPQAYINETDVAIRILYKAHEAALKYYSEKNYKKAAEIMGYGFEYWYFDFPSVQRMDEELSNDENYSSAKVLTALGDYGLFLYKAGEKDKSIEVNTKITNMDNKTPGPFLQLGDAYYDKENFIEATKVYKRYIELMKEKGLETKIPSRVNERVK